MDGVPIASDLSINQPYAPHELLLRIAAGDEKAFSYFVSGHASKLYTYIFRITNNHSESEELVQDIFIQLWQTRETLPAVHNPDAYLYVLARNRAVNALKRLVRERNALDQWQSQAWLQDEGNEGPDKMNLLEQAIAQLPPQQQRIWQMSRKDHMKYAEIAEILGISKDAVNKSLQAAGKNITAYVLQNLDVLMLSIIILNFF